jgi:hypothetical protein
VIEARFAALRRRLIEPITLAFLVALSSPAQAQLQRIPPDLPSGVCDAEATTIGYFNGVLNTRLEAESSLHMLRRKVILLAPQSRVRFQLFYNPSRGFLDFLEVFLQRAPAELQSRIEIAWDVLHGGGAFLDLFAQSPPALLATLSGLIEGTIPMKADLLRSARNDIQAVSQEFRAGVDRNLRLGRKLLIVAHSQGNLFAQPLVAYARSQSSDPAVQFIQVAPATQTLSGSHMLADQDLVIAALNRLDPAPTVTPNLFIPACLSGAQQCQIWPGAGRIRDALGHNFIQTYGNDALGQTSAPLPALGRVLDALASTALNAGQPTRTSCPNFSTAILQLAAFSVTQTGPMIGLPAACGPVEAQTFSQFTFAPSAGSTPGGTATLAGCFLDSFQVSPTSEYRFTRELVPGVSLDSTVSIGGPTPNSGFFYVVRELMSDGYVSPQFGWTNVHSITLREINPNTLAGPVSSQLPSPSQRLHAVLSQFGAMECSPALIAYAGEPAQLPSPRAQVVYDAAGITIRTYRRSTDGRSFREVLDVLSTAELNEMANRSDYAEQYAATQFGAGVTGDAIGVDKTFSITAFNANPANSIVNVRRNAPVAIPGIDVIKHFTCVPS